MDRTRHERKKHQNRAAAKRYRDRLTMMRGGILGTTAADGGGHGDSGDQQANVGETPAPRAPPPTWPHHIDAAAASLPASWPQILHDLSSSLQTLPENDGQLDV
ncbi:hypothetical protein ACOMHN_022964 [Nucella lapillus]